MLEGYKHLASSIEETPEKQFASLDIKEKINNLENAIIEEHIFNNELTLRGTHYGPINDIKMEGNTLINLIDGAVWTDGWLSSNIKVTPSDNKYSYVGCFNSDVCKSFLTGNTVVTVSFEVTTLPTNAYQNGFTFVKTDGSYLENTKIIISSTGKYVSKIILEGGGGNERISPQFFSNCLNMTDVSGALRVINFCIYEGSKKDTESTDYIEGISSVGTGGYLKLRSCGKNLFNHFSEHITSDVERIDEKEFKTSLPWQRLDKIVLYPNKKYILSGEIKSTDEHRIKAYTTVRMDYFSRGGIINYTGIPIVNASNVDITTEYIRYLTNKFRIPSTSCKEFASLIIRNAYEKELFVKNLMLEEVDDNEYVYKYEPFISSECNIKLKYPLRGLPNGVRDSIEMVDGEYVIIRRCKEVILNSKLEWQIVSIDSSTITRFCTINIPNVKSKWSMVRSNFVPYKTNNMDYVNPGVFTSNTLSVNNSAFINIDIPPYAFKMDSMILHSSSLKQMFSVAFRLSKSCSTELAPTSTLVTRLSLSSQANAISANDW